MENAKLIGLLDRLKAEEWTRLRQFLASPYFNEDEEPLRLFDLLHRHWQAHQGSWNIQRESVYKALRPHQTYDAKAFNYLLSKLNTLAETFLSVNHWQDDPYRAELAALDVFSDRGMDKHYAYQKRRLERKLELPGTASMAIFEARYQFADIRDRHYLRKRKRVYDPAIQDSVRELDRFYFLRRLRLACSMLDRQHIFQEGYELELSEGWLAHLLASPLIEEPIIGLYYAIFRMLREEEDEHHFQRLKTGLKSHSASLNTDDLTDIYQFAINYCARKLRHGREHYAGEAQQLYLEGITGGFYMENGQLSPWTFTNVVKLYLRQERYEEARAFIDQYEGYLPEPFRANALHYNLAELFYYTRELDQAQVHLTRVAFSDLNYYLGARVMLSKIYWEVEADEALTNLLASFTKFLQRNKKISRGLKHTYLNFCRLLVRILRTPLAERKELQAAIRKTEPLTDREWLLSLCN